MRLARAFGAVVAVGILGIAVLLAGVRLRHGGGERFEDRSAEPRIPPERIETVANLELPPGNLAVSPEGRIFFTFHPEAGPEVKVAELVNGEPRPYPDAAFQQPREAAPFFQSVLSVRIDRQNRLWTLDYADHGTGQPRLLAFDLATDELVHRYDFPSEMAPLGSHLNDFQVSADGSRIYIADASIMPCGSSRIRQPSS